MRGNRILVTALLFLLCGCLGTGDPKPLPEEPPREENVKESPRPEKPTLPPAKEEPKPPAPLFGEAVNRIQAHAYPHEVRVLSGEKIRFEITLRNTGKRPVSFPDMAYPVTWSFSFTHVESGAYYGCWGRVVIPEGQTEFSPLLPPSKEITFEIMLPGTYGGWNTVRILGPRRRSAMPVGFPPPGRYRVHGIYRPFHASRPALRDTPGWGMKTQDVSVTVKAAKRSR
ncbi:MAG: hypothetical protein ACYTHM_15925 [Planctomycetota bacterium]|jgi:hypothetical protein